MVHEQLEIMTEQFLRQSVHVHADTLAAIELQQSCSRGKWRERRGEVNQQKIKRDSLGRADTEGKFSEPTARSCSNFPWYTLVVHALPAAP